VVVDLRELYNIIIYRVVGKYTVCMYIDLATCIISYYKYNIIIVFVCSSAWVKNLLIKLLLSVLLLHYYRF